MRYNLHLARQMGKTIKGLVKKVFERCENFQLGELFAGAGGLARRTLHAEKCSEKIIHAWENDGAAFTCDTY